MNPFISLLNKAKKGFCSLLNLYRKHPSFIRIVITVLVLFSFFVILSIYLPSCKSPATLTSDTQHHARDSTRHTTVHRIETHDTIVIGPSKSPLKGDSDPPCPSLKGRELFSPFKGELERVLEGDIVFSSNSKSRAWTRKADASVNAVLGTPARV